MSKKNGIYANEIWRAYLILKTTIHKISIWNHLATLEWHTELFTPIFGDGVLAAVYPRDYERLDVFETQGFIISGAGY